MPRDDNPEQALRAASWQRVRDDFERLASKPLVSLVALVTDGDADPSAFLRELAARENRAHWQGTVIRPVDGQPDEYEPVPASHRLFGFGEPEAWEAFRVAAMRAGVLAKAVPKHLLPASVCDRMGDLDRWAWALFEIGWRKLDSVPFRAERWVRDDGGAVQLELARSAGLYRGWYYSEIGDAVSASIDVVDLLRTMEPEKDRQLLWTDHMVRVYKPGGGEPELVSASSMLSPLWDARPLESDSWGNIYGFDDGQGGGDFIDMRLWLRATPGMVNEPPMYRPAHAPLPPFFKSGGVRRCYRPTGEDTAAVRALYPAHRNPHAPPWQRVEADLIVAGHARDKLVDLNPPALLGLLRKARGQDGAADNAAGETPKRNRPGRKPDTDPKEDKRIFDAWQSGQYKTYAELESELRLSTGEGKRACDRHRKRLPKGK